MRTSMQQNTCLSVFLLLPCILLYQLSAKAQSPGGVEGCEAWFVTTPVTSDLNGSYRWSDLSGDSTTLLHVNGSLAGTEVTEPRDSVQTFNFHPALRLSPALGFMDAVLRRTNLAQTTIVGVFVPDSTGEARLLAVAGRDTAMVTRDKILHCGESDTLDYSPDLSHAFELETAPKVVSWQKAMVPHHSPWGEANEATLSLGGDPLAGTPSFTTANFGNLQGMSGWCPELVAYGRTLSPYERTCVETYLALKYGITLKRSYYIGENILWEADPAWQRVTGILCDRHGALHQPFSTTSYEEHPREATRPDGDSFFNRDSHGKASQNRLLVMGRHFTDSIPDGSYMMWGDDGGDTHTTTGTGGRNVMARKWLVRTDIETVPSEPELEPSNVEVTMNGGAFDLNARIMRSPRLAIGPRTSADLHFAFACPANNVSFYIGTALRDAMAPSEGYAFDNGKVYKVVQGVQASEPFLQDVRGCDIDIFKVGDDLHLQVNGSGDTAYTIVTPITMAPNVPIRDDPGYNTAYDKQSGYSCRGLVMLAPGMTLNGLRADGFSDTGSWAELSYDIADGSFKSRRNGRAYLMASGAGGTRFFQSTGFDPERKKILFHNLNLADRDTVTFAWNDALIADVEATEASCNGQDGTIHIHASDPGPSVTYSCIMDTRNLPLGQNFPFGSHDVVVGNLAPGTYHLSVVRTAYDELHAWAASDTEYMTAMLPDGGNSLLWSYDGSGNAYSAGLLTTGTAVRNGFMLRNDTAWFVCNGNPQNPVRVLPGDRLGIMWDRDSVILTAKGRVMRYVDGMGAGTMFRANFGRGTTTLCDIHGMGPASTHVFSSDRVMFESKNSGVLNYEVHIGSACGDSTYVTFLGGVTPPVPSPPRQSEKSVISPDKTETNPLSAHGDPLGALNVTATLDPAAARGPVQMLLFDAAGRLHRKGRTISSPPYTETFSVDAPGIYLVKALTGNAEHTIKAACGHK